MEFSEKGVYIIGAIVGLLLSIPIIWWIGRFFINRENVKVKPEITRKSYFVFLIIIPIFYAFSIIYHYVDVILLIGVGMILEGIALYFYLRHFSRVKFSGNREDNLTTTSLIYISFTMLLFIIIVTVGTIFATQWFMPDIVKITDNDGQYEANEQYILPYTRGTRPGCSYIDNETSDTIYRIIVKYAYLGEELNNKFAIQEKYAPGQFAKMSSRPDYSMKLIPPVMLPSHDRYRGRYHTRRVFLTDRNHLEDFHNLNMTEFGLKENLFVDSLAPDRNRVLREDSAHYNAYKVINPNPYKYSKRH